VRHDTDPPRHVANQTFEDEDENDNEYEDEYDCRGSSLPVTVSEGWQPDKAGS
jgi:hypothetical protein